MGTNPHSWGFPTQAAIGFPIVIDWATSTVAMGRVQVLKREGKKLPPGCAVDAEGRETDDPNKAVALLPFGALAILLGHLMTVESIGPIAGGTVSLLAIVSGTWFPATGFLHTVGQWLPSYWLVQAGRVTLEGHGWGTQGWAVVIAWTALLAALAALAYRRDTGRV